MSVTSICNLVQCFARAVRCQVRAGWLDDLVFWLGAILLLVTGAMALPGLFAGFSLVAP